jgi:hypothetical protein
MRWRVGLLAIQLLILGFAIQQQHQSRQTFDRAMQSYRDATALYAKANYLFKHSCSSDDLVASR